MGNMLFQQARSAVDNAVDLSTSHNGNLHHAVEVAKNALSSAYANSTIAEKEQLRELQNTLYDIH